MFQLLNMSSSLEEAALVSEVVAREDIGLVLLENLLAVVYQQRTR